MTDCEKLFPKWISARVILTAYVSGIRGWKVTCGTRNAIRISLDSSINIVTPAEVRPLVYSLIQDAASACLPDLSSFLGSPNDSVTEQNILQHLNDHMTALFEQGEPDLKSRIAEALGLSSTKPQRAVTLTASRIRRSKPFKILGQTSVRILHSVPPGH
jgi:hypothetical protein